MSIYKGGNKPFTTEEFIEKANLVHNYKYDYSLVDYTNARTKVKIICPVHGIFEQTPDSHLRGNGCKKCGAKKGHNKQKLTQEDFIKKMSKYTTLDFSKSKYVNAKTPVAVKCLVCKKEFKKNPNELDKNGCPFCANIKRQETLKKLRYEKSLQKINKLLEKCNAELLGKYNGKFEIRGHKFKRYNLKCKKCNYIFKDYFDDKHLPLCPICNPGKLSSKGELEIRKLILDKYPQLKILPNDRDVLEGKEIDIYIPELRIGFEYDGIYWHRDKEYDKFKDELAKKKGITIYHILEKRRKKEKEENLQKVCSIIDNYLKEQ